MQQNFNYSNPLDKFRSYSYHFILTVANTTEAFRKMLGSHSTTPLYSRVSDVNLGGEILLEGGDKAFLILDTRRFSQYSITHYETEHIYGTGDRINPSVPANLTNIKIIDTTGLSFINFMMDVFRNRVKSTRASSFFLLNIIFVGHRDSGQQEEIISTCYIPLLLLTMSGEFSSAGSTWDLSFIETEGGISRGSSLSDINHLGTTQAITTPENNNTLGGMLQQLEKKLNDHSVAFFSKYVNKALGSGINPGDTGKLVQYMINIPPEWQSFELSALAKSRHLEQRFAAAREAAARQNQPAPPRPQQQINISNNGRYSQISFSPNTTITDAITQILESSTQILDMGSMQRRKEGKAITFKILTNITSDATSYIVHFDIYPYYAPRLDQNGRAIAIGTGPSSAAITNSGQESIIRNVLYYDYIFTGRNSHIEDLKITYGPESAIALDMNLELGGARLAKNSNLMCSARQVDIDNAAQSTKRANDSNIMIRPGDPIFPVTRTMIQNSNNSSQAGTEEFDFNSAIEILRKRQEYSQTVAMLHFLSSLQLNMVVRGNPNIIKKFADRNERGSIAPHSAGKIISAAQIQEIPRLDSNTAKINLQRAVSITMSSAKQLYMQQYYLPKMSSKLRSSDPDDVLLNGIDVASLPLFAKINILAPNVDYAGNFIDGEDVRRFTDKFFFTGHYMVLMIKHVLSDGKFSHDMTLIPFDVSEDFSASGDTGVRTEGSTR